MTAPSRFTYANVMSTAAVVIALAAGTSYAAEKVQLPKDSVGAKQLKDDAVRSDNIQDGAVGANDLGAGSVGSGQLANGAVTDSKLSPATLAALSQPRAYGVFTGAGTLVAARSKNVTVSKLPGYGAYCVTPTPASGIDPTRTTIVATPDFSDGTGAWHIVQLVNATQSTQPTDCPGGFELVTDTDVNPFSRADIAVSFVIP